MNKFEKLLRIVAYVLILIAWVAVFGFTYVSRDLLTISERVLYVTLFSIALFIWYILVVRVIDK